MTSGRNATTVVRFVVTVAAALALASCAPTLSIVSYEPGRIAPKGARELVLVDAEGRASARQLAAEIVRNEGRGGWFRVSNRAKEGIKLTLVGEAAQIAPPDKRIEADEMWARVDVVEWDSEPTTIEDEDDDGNVVSVPAEKHEATLQITVADSAGNVLMREQEYRGVVIVPEGTVTLDHPLQEAARAAAASFLEDIAPRRTTQIVRLDDGDSALRKTLDYIVKGRYSMREGERRIRKYLKKNQTSAIATYNLAVVVDAQGRHDEALQIYDDAMRIYTRDYYVEARAGCARRAQAKRAVFGDPQPAQPQPAAPVEPIPDDDAKAKDAKPTAAPSGAAPPAPT